LASQREPTLTMYQNCIPRPSTGQCQADVHITTRPGTNKTHRRTRRFEVSKGAKLSVVNSGDRLYSLRNRYHEQRRPHLLSPPGGSYRLKSGLSRAQSRRIRRLSKLLNVRGRKCSEFQNLTRAPKRGCFVQDIPDSNPLYPVSTHVTWP
jgi:hypothetical protein